jgi:hypothetical protein
MPPSIASFNLFRSQKVAWVGQKQQTLLCRATLLRWLIAGNGALRESHLAGIDELAPGPLVTHEQVIGIATLSS